MARLNRNTTTGAISQPGGTAGCVERDGAGPCADGHGLEFPNWVAVSPDGKSVYVASSAINAVARLNRNTTTGAISQPAGAAGCVSDDGAGPCANGHALEYAASVAVSPDNKSVYVASFDKRRRGALRSQHDHWGDPPARRRPRLHQRERGGTLPRRPRARRRRSRWRPAPDGKSVYVASSQQAVQRRGAPHPQPDHGAITQPAGATGCVSEDGAGNCVDGYGLYFPPNRWRSARTGRASTSPQASPWRVSTARPDGRPLAEGLCPRQGIKLFGERFRRGLRPAPPRARPRAPRPPCPSRPGRGRRPAPPSDGGR